MLEASNNPFATVVMAHLKTLETRQDRQKRKEWKLTLTKRLYERGFQRQDIINLLKFIDWIMTLPEELEQEFQQELIQYEEDRKMPYITNFEKTGIRKGILEGIELALELKFGNEGLSLLPEILTILDVDQLRAILSGIKAVTTIEELRQIYQNS